MYLIALATDYDGTIAFHGVVDAPTVAALERLKASGRKLILVTGRDLPDLKRVFDRFDLFDIVVAENGALLYRPAAQEEELLAPAPPAELVDALRERGVRPLVVGRGIVATWEPNERTVLECIHALGLEWQIIFNKGAVMVLPPGVNKATGLAAALKDLELSPLNVIGVGDAENDHAFLQASGCSVAVANALDAVKATADLVATRDHGAGVAEVIDALLADETPLARRAGERRNVRLGPDDAATLSVSGGAVLIAGSSGVGKSTIATAIIEKLADQGFQTCVMDPEGDYDDMPGAVVLGDGERAPTVTEVLDILRRPDDAPVVVNMLGVGVRDRPAFFAELMEHVRQLRERTARPHWLVIDEAHHMLPADGEPGHSTDSSAVVHVTVHPQSVRRSVLESVRTLIAVGPQADDVVRAFCGVLELPIPDAPPPGAEDQVLYWNRDVGPPRWIGVDLPRREHQRHTRKYAVGELGEDRSFYFRGPQDALRLRAQNLMIFLQMAEGVDDATWLHHLHRGDYARWFREAIKDEDLAREADELQDSADPAASREAMREMVERRYGPPV